jgi:hypothetical protein
MSTAGTNVSSSATMQFADYSPGYIADYQSDYDPTVRAADDASLGLAQFMARPTVIFTTVWTYNQNVYEYLRPWALFMKQPNVANRISNFARFRGKLHLKILLNGNGFYYGKLAAGYLPLAAQYPRHLPDGTSNTDLMSISQMQHIYLCASGSTGGEIVCPFISQYNGAKLDEQGAVDSYNNLGFLYLNSLNTLQHANDPACPPLRIVIYAWMTDLELFAPTTSPMDGLVPQAGEDEYAKKPVSSIASAVANATGALTKVPMIGPYMRISSTIAGGFASVARTLGYCRPQDVVEPTRMVPTYMGNMATGAMSDTGQKLTFDPKQEVTVDPRVTGFPPVDEMDLTSFAQRESYLTTLTWQTTDDPNTQLGAFAVAPSHFNNVGSRIHFTPVCYAAMPFLHWRGNIKFRFQIASSNYHKGRLRFVYFPNNPEVIDYSRMNLLEQSVVDISEKKDFTIECGWRQAEPYKQLNRTPSNTGKGSYVTGLDDWTTNYDGREDNGWLAVVVQNDLTVPNAVVGTKVFINVFVSAGSDIEYANPTGSRMGQYFHVQPYPSPAPPEPAPPEDCDLSEQLRSQAGEPPGGNDPAADSECCDNEPEKHEIDSSVGGVVNTHDEVTGIHFGERVKSIRQLCKRFTLNEVRYNNWSGGQGDNYVVVYFHPDFPMYRGPNPDGFYASTSGNLNSTYNSFITWFTPCFIARRGGIRWKWRFLNSPGPCQMQVNRAPHIQAQGLRYESWPIANIAEGNYNLGRYHIDCSAGGSATAVGQNPIVEAEMPFHSNVRFWYGPAVNMNNPGDKTSEDQKNTGFHTIDLIGKYDGTGNTAAHIGYVAGADDFSLSGFIMCPVLYSSTLPPPLN